MRVVFMGNHTVGVRTLESLCRSCEVAGVVAHPPDVEDGVRYESVCEFARHQGLLVSRLRPTDAQFEPFVRESKPDLIWLTDYRYLVPLDVLNLAPLGAINLHPSLLPKYRGRAPLNWAIINGETQLGLTAHVVSDQVDSGDIVAQQSYELAPNEDVGDALEKLYPMYQGITGEVVRAFVKGSVQRVPQPSGDHKFYPPRRPEDGWIDWNKRATDICNLVRAVSQPYPGAFGFVSERRVTIWKCSVKRDSVNIAPGTILKAAGDDSFEVACGDGTLIVTDYSVDTPSDDCNIRACDRFELENRLATPAGST
ncbi:MAG: hypothetical protein DHS20C16_25800 [Phycisphaerae bacterium]|nr:MAG: hypothetical protein DHS20C16_25800 [Phycisphaerae bacterium]